MPSLPPPLRELTKGFDRSPEHVVITDRDGRIVYANHGAVRHTGYSLAEMLGRKPGQLWGGHMPRELYDDMWEAVRVQKHAFVADMRNRTKAGRSYWQEVHVLPILDARNEPEYFIGIELFINEATRRERLLREQRGEATERWRIRWPLGWLLQADSLSPAQLDELQGYYAHPDALDALTNDLLLVARARSAERDEHATLRMKELLREVLVDWQAKFPDRHYDVVADGRDVIVREDRKWVREVLDRLVANACQYTSPEIGDVVLLLLKTDQSCIVRCQDNGIGISFSDQKRMFDEFYRGAAARRRHPDGSGLGLYLAKTIADARGWAITCMSEPGCGSCFELQMPLRNPEANIPRN